MKEQPSRREWLLGLVGAVFGVSAAREVDRWLPGKKTKSGNHIGLALRSGSSTFSTFLEVKGKIEIIPDLKAGTFLVRVHDEQGRLVHSYDSPLASLWVPQPERPTAIGHDTTSTYDSDGNLIEVVGETYTARFYYGTYPGGSDGSQG